MLIFLGPSIKDMNALTDWRVTFQITTSIDAYDSRDRSLTCSPKHRTNKIIFLGLFWLRQDDGAYSI